MNRSMAARVVVASMIATLTAGAGMVGLGNHVVQAAGSSARPPASAQQAPAPRGPVAAAPGATSVGTGNGGWSLPSSSMDRPRGIVPRLHPGQPSRNASQTNGSFSTNPNCVGCNPPLLFTVGSPVMGGISGTPGNVTITPVYWLPSGYVYSANYKTVINGYIADVASASRQNTNVFSVGTQYYQQATLGSPIQHIQYVVTAGVEVDDTAAFPVQNPSPGCTADPGFTDCVTDGALRTELRARLTSLSRPQDDSHLYLVFFPQGVETCVAPGSTGAGTACSTNVYCAYHWGVTVGSSTVIYANEPFPDLAHCSGGQAPNGDPEADAQVSLISHEANESITDAFGTWNDSTGAENGDLCAYVYGAPLGSTGVANTAYNQVIGTGRYYTQDEFSNEDYALGAGDLTMPGGVQVAGCVQGDELPTASFNSPCAVTAGMSVPFDASPSSDPDNTSALSYSWNWGDGTPNSAGPNPSHAFPSAGTDTVTLQVTDVDGWSGTISHVVTVSSTPVLAVAAISPSFGTAAGGTGVTITGSGFNGVTGVAFGATAAGAFTVNNTSQITATSPAGSGTVDVRVTAGGVTSAICAADQFTYRVTSISYFSWFDNVTGGMVGDNIHVVNPGGTTANVTVSLPGASSLSFSVGAGAEQHVTFPAGHIGGPVKVTSTQPVRASQRVQYFQSFNEVWAMDPAQAAITSYINWFDLATPGMVGDNIHVLNPGGSTATVTVSLPGANPMTFSLGAGLETHVSFPVGHIGGPVTITSTLPVLASSRVQYFQSFNEVAAQNLSEAATTSYFHWFDKATPGMVGDNIHIVNPGVTTATGTVSLGGTPVGFSVAPGLETYVTFPVGRIGGPVTVNSTARVLASQRVQYFQSFNEVASVSPNRPPPPLYIMWFDLATPGMVGDNIHILNPQGVNAVVTVTLPGASSIIFTVAPGAEAHVSFPAGHIGGPITIISTTAVLAAQRVQYFQSFNEVPAN